MKKTLVNEHSYYRFKVNPNDPKCRLDLTKLPKGKALPEFLNHEGLLAAMFQQSREKLAAGCYDEVDWSHTQNADEWCRVFGYAKWQEYGEVIRQNILAQKSPVRHREKVKKKYQKYVYDERVGPLLEANATYKEIREATGLTQKNVQHCEKEYYERKAAAEKEKTRREAEEHDRQTQPQFPFMGDVPVRRDDEFD